MIIQPKKKHQQQIQEMWKLCFPDTDAFIRFYFEKIYRKEDALILVDENEIPLAFLQILPHQIKIEESVYTAGYLSGVMTHPGHRNQGHMNALMKAALELMKKRQYTFSFLIPQNAQMFDIYSKYGFERAFPKSFGYTDLKINDKLIYETVKIYDSFNELRIDEVYATYSWFLSQKENVVLKTKDQFVHILEDLFLDGGRVFYIEQEGIALIFTWKHQVAIKELFCKKGINTKELLLGAIRIQFNVEEAVMLDYHLTEQSRFGGMISILDTNFSEDLPADIYMSMMLD